MFIHVMMTASARMSLVVSAVYTSYFLLGMFFYLYHKVLRRYWLGKRFIIAEVIPEGDPVSAKIWTLRMSPRQGKMFFYQPGQFGFLRIFGPRITPEEHPFSIASAPANQEYLAITIKELGDYTETVKNVKPGFEALLDAPYGRFSYINFRDEEGLVLLAGGVGITPVLSMARQIRATESRRKVLLFWGVNTSDELVFQKELFQMQEEMDNFKFIPVVLDEIWSGEKGLIDRAKIEKALKKYDFQPGRCGFYICGPANMMKAMVKMLKAMGVAKKRIHYESFAL